MTVVNAHKSGHQIPEMTNLVTALRENAGAIIEQLSEFDRANGDPFAD